MKYQSIFLSLTMEGSKAIRAADSLVKLKEEEIISYAHKNKEIILPYLKLQKQLDELRSNAIDIRMKQVPLIMKLKR